MGVLRKKFTPENAKGNVSRKLVKSSGSPQAKCLSIEGGEAGDEIMAQDTNGVTKSSLVINDYPTSHL